MCPSTPGPKPKSRPGSSEAAQRAQRSRALRETAAKKKVEVMKRRVRVLRLRSLERLAGSDSASRNLRQRLLAFCIRGARIEPRSYLPRIVHRSKADGVK